jgi:hypothetical protein
MGSALAGVNRRFRRWLLIALPLALLLSACGAGNINATPTLGLDTIATSAYMTFSAELTAKAELAPPTGTPTNTPVPTLALPTALPTFALASSTPLVGGTSDCDDAAWLADVTIPDGTIMSPGQTFTKTWSLLNNGTCAWSTAYKLAFHGGDAMQGAVTTLPMTVPVGATAEISVQLTAPEEAGTFKGNWQLQNDKNQPFGSVVFVQIQVGAGNSTTPGPTSATGTVTISGNVGRADAVLNYTGASGKYPSGQVVANGAGKYTITVPYGWYGKVEPDKGNWTFEPASRDYVNVTSNQTGQDYIAY